ncbi:MAG TPA: pentapeptide repeat-containing protein [Pyrinomonadaceae bacterium]|jgi:hypothetical protein
MLKKLIYVICIAFFLILLFWAAFPGYAPEWTGFGPYDPKINGPRSKKLWDWMTLLIIPTFLALGAWLLNKLQKKSEQQIETDRQRQSAMESYFNKITELLLEKDLRNGNSIEAHTIARSWTLAMFKVLDNSRKAQVLQFIYELGLIDKQPIINLNGANLSGIDLEGATLRGAEIRGVQFNNANLKYVNFIDADLRGTNFNGADLSFANLSGANLIQAKLENTRNENVNLINANLEQTKWAKLENKTSENRILQKKKETD